MQYLFIHPTLALAIASAIVLAALAWLTLDLRLRWSRVFGAKTKNANEALSEVFQRLAAAEAKLKGIEPRLVALERIGTIAVQKFGFLRFNPFGDTGSDQSFAVCLLDRADNGFVLSSLYTRGGVRIYAKEIKAGSSKHQLSDEEKTVLEQAIRGTKFQITNHKL